MKKLFTTLLASIAAISLLAQPPSNYYDSAEGKNGEELIQALHEIIDNHISLSYSDLWDAFYDTDRKDDGTVWDMYSTCSFTFFDDQDSGSGGTSECEYYNREHSFPASWFGSSSPMYTDLFHIYPTDKKVNSVRANYPFGEVGSASYTSSNGSKLGSCSYTGYSGTVFEPTDEYKGDFARTYFYMVTRYYDNTQTWDSPMLNGTNFPAFEEWALNLLIDWHELDPVSQKEINRNNAIYNDYQENRNPFIDNPDFVNDIWRYANSSTTNTLQAFSVTLSPNPAKDLVSIEVSSIDNYKVDVYNLLGNKMLESSNNATHTNTPIDISNLPNGIYIVCVTSKEVKVVKRLIVGR